MTRKRIFRQPLNKIIRTPAGASSTWTNFCVQLSSSEAIHDNDHKKYPSLNFALSSSIWKGEKLFPNYRRPFHLFAITNPAYKLQKAILLSESGLCAVWLPVCNPLHNSSRSPAVNRKPSYQRVIKEHAVPCEAETASNSISPTPILPGYVFEQSVRS